MDEDGPWRIHMGEKSQFGRSIWHSMDHTKGRPGSWVMGQMVIHDPRMLSPYNDLKDFQNVHEQMTQDYNKMG